MRATLLRWTIVRRFVLLFAMCSCAQADWTDRAVEAMGLPTSHEKATEIRVWLGGGVVHPFRLVRVWETAHGVRGERIVWSDSPTKSIRRLMKKQHCEGTLQQVDEIVWCVNSQDPWIEWELFLKDLQPELLLQLPREEELGQRDCVVADGEIVGIEVIRGSRHHRVHYDNPEWCCRWPACATANHVRSIANRLR